MAHTAATLSTPHASRRRSQPAARERVGAMAGIVSAVGLVLVMFMLASTPGVDSSPAVVREHLSTHDTVVLASAYVMMAAALLLVPFLMSLGSFTDRRTDDSKWRWPLTVVAGATAITMLSLAGGLLATATALAGRTGEDEAAFALFVAAKLIATLSMVAVAGVLLANGRAIASRRRPDHWHVRFDIEIVVMSVIASIASLTGHHWVDPGGPVVVALWFVVALWIVALARTILRGPREEAT